MSDTKTGDEKTLSVTPTKTLTLKPRGVEQGVVRQSFSHGRTKAVVVEKVKRRVGPGAKAEAAPTTAPTPARRPAGIAKVAAVSAAMAPTTVSAQTHGGVALKPSGLVLPTLEPELVSGCVAVFRKGNEWPRERPRLVFSADSPTARLDYPFAARLTLFHI